MHYGSDFAEYGCRSSSALWDGFLADFLIRKFHSNLPPMKKSLSPASSEISKREEHTETLMGVASCGIKKTAVLLVGSRFGAHSYFMVLLLLTFFLIVLISTISKSLLELHSV
jgi:hypothetical protein